MRRLEVVGADFRGRDVSGDGQHRHTRAMTLKEAVDQVQVTRSTTPRADCECPGQMGLGTGGECSHFLVPDV